MNAQPLKILSASAGSGKTFSLVRQYLLLLFRSDRPYPFSNIVAMTFTNLAALEMKLRIVEALYQLAYPEHNKSASAHEDYLQQELVWSKEELHKKSREHFLNLLHRYEEFAVTTIDKFNLRLIRSFSRELDLPPEFEVVIETNTELNRLLDMILSDLGDTKNETLNELALGFSESQLEEGKSWDFVKTLKDFYSILTNEGLHDSVEMIKIQDYGTQHFFGNLKEKKRKELELQKLLEKASADLLAQAGDPEKIIGKSTTIGALQADKMLENLNNKGHILTPAKYRDLSQGNKSNEPRPDLVSIIDKTQEKAITINDEIRKLNAICNSHHPMAFMQVLQKRLEQYRIDEQVLLISEFNSLLSALIQEEEAPFIYERIGTKVDHFLLDEFQDTSRLQWLNLIPLVDESLAHGRTCFIVGDPKQSIYRFKNGLPEQFVALPAIYNPEQNPLIEQRSRRFVEKSKGKENLENNWRSTETIVDINNTFFSDVVAANPLWQLDSYADVKQNPIKKETGYLEFYYNSERVEIDEDYIDLLDEWIKDAKASGFKPSDIAIIGTTNKDCTRWAKELTMKGHQLVSADALRVDADFAVRYCIAYLEYRAHPGSRSAQKNLAAMTLRQLELPSETLSDYENKDGRRSEENFLKDQLDESVLHYHFTSVYDLINAFANKVGIPILENYYYSHLLDIAHEFDMRFGPDLDRFIDEYKEHKKKSSVMLPDSPESIQILTIHKSKGLEFPVVLMPKLLVSPTKLNSKKYFFHLEDEVVNITISEAKKIAELNALAEEMEETEAKDHLNKLYVAMTRAVERQYIHFNSENKKPAIPPTSPYHDALVNLVAKATELEPGRYCIGEKLPAKGGKRESNSSNYYPEAIGDHLWFPDIALKHEHLREDEHELSEERRYGTQLHELLSEIENAEDMAHCLENGLIDGRYEIEFKDRLESDAKRIHQNCLAPIIDQAKQIWREQDLFDPQTKEKIRPDLMYQDQNEEYFVLDFKSGQVREKDKKQVLRYAKVLHEAFGKPVKAGLIYTDQGVVDWV